MTTPLPRCPHHEPADERAAQSRRDCPSEHAAISLSLPGQGRHARRVHHGDGPRDRKPRRDSETTRA